MDTSPSVHTHTYIWAHLFIYQCSATATYLRVLYK